MTPDQDEARVYFDKASEYFQQAVDEVNFSIFIQTFIFLLNVFK